MEASRSFYSRDRQEHTQTFRHHALYGGICQSAPDVLLSHGSLAESPSPFLPDPFRYPIVQR